mmetsp:Transcript_7060/g.15299  ORF Transcript_7060/g.15299 Transcript_7060/m.15299 type:complete len:101 (-) Transcript_7060:193-495(-)|eukprot:CAMPEP_0113305000 /NCGR_PEP_ID=MMETSP0010_2-20120614/4788_1 /TAXON_ID=216773 ORGANISM="Corethron hystrix, Strain 308" /NCGR_SAMPLE_ID=MMETSP0010_2 /ASSEMBLY_ACC=CAM_ASM_000155 /LENGTH=100 /DNA_ID=CAMNT_0000159303 /DNA_START=126 /DNA_END=428 /DNA_ORIENTATION=+ /assembly_acc=CAM_ASM_000155
MYEHHVLLGTLRESEGSVSENQDKGSIDVALAYGRGNGEGHGHSVKGADSAPKGVGEVVLRGWRSCHRGGGGGGAGAGDGLRSLFLVPLHRQFCHFFRTM